MGVIRVRVGAQLEPGATVIFQPLIAAAKQARAKIGAEGAAMGSDFVGGYRTAPAHAKAAGAAMVAAAQKTAAAITAAERRAGVPALVRSLARVRQSAPDHFGPMAREMLTAAKMTAAEPTVADCEQATHRFLDGLDALIANARPYLTGEIGVTYTAAPASC